MKKMTAAMIVMIMAASSVCIIPAADTSDGAESDIPGISELRVGEVMGIKYAGDYNMNKILKNVGPAINMLVEDVADSLDMTPDEFVSMLETMGLKKAPAFLKSILADPEQKVSKTELIAVLNELLYSTGITVNDIDLAMSWNYLSSIKKIAENDYQEIDTLNMTVKVTMDFTSTNQSIPPVYLKDAMLTVRAIADSRLTLGAVDSFVNTNNEVDIAFSGISNFINDKASSMEDLIKILSSERNFNITLNMKNTVFAEMFTAEGFVLPTVPDETLSTGMSVSLAVQSEMTSSNVALEAFFADQNMSYSKTVTAPCKVTYRTYDRVYGNHYEIILYQYDQTGIEYIIGTIYTSPTKYGLMFSYGGMDVSTIVDIKNLNFILTVEIEQLPTEGITDQITGFISKLYILASDESYIVGIDDNEFDMTELMKKIRGQDVRYGASYILTDDEVKSFEKDVSKTAYALDFDVIGFNGENLNVNPDADDKKCPISLNMQIVIVMAIATLIAIIALAVSHGRACKM